MNLPLIKGMRGTSLGTAFVLNSIATALISTIIVEIRLSQNKNSKTSKALNKLAVTFLVGLFAAFTVYNTMYILVGYGSSLSATKSKVKYW